VHLIPGGLPHRILADMADLTKPYPLPFHMRGDDQKLPGQKSSMVKRVVMSLIEASHYFKTNREGRKKVSPSICGSEQGLSGQLIPIHR
jgi:hypothetical protein